MNADRWSQIQTLFEAALERRPDERVSFLEDACPDDPDLLAEVRSLLDADADVHPLLDSVAIDAVALPGDLLPTGVLSAEGEQIGPYRVVRTLGRGGMGAVFLAERDDGQFEQQVALKVIRGGVASARMVRSFESERQILARLQHPNIARLLDGGLTDDGRPWFALEYVDGVPLDAYCAANDCSVNERVALVRTVCEAVQYAHRRLIIHRDLKPSNILVTPEGTVKLLDFGIAKILSPGDDDPSEAPLTQTGHAVMTPAYAAPEQVQHAPVTTATDVYALGVVLYELLAERRPLALSDRSPAEVERIVSTHRPDPPSTHAPPDRRRQLQGDLDTICLKALRKEPERRYASAEQLSDDLQRYLEGRPVAARPDTLGYRTRKFLRRHRGVVAVAAAVVLLIASIVGVYTVQLAQERDRAQLEAAKAEEVTAFLQDIFAVSDPSESRGDTITARELLDRGAARIETELAAQPDVQAQMRLVTGEVYGSLGLYDDAETQLTRALAARRALYGDGHADVAEVHNALGILHEQRGRYEAAAAAHRSALAIQQEDGSGAEPLEVAHTLHSLGHAQMRLGRYDEAERLVREALAIKRQQLGARHREVAYSLNVLADILTHQRRFAEAEAIHRDVLALRRRVLGNDHLDVAVTLHNLGANLLNQQRYADAEGMYRDALEVWRALYDGDHQEIANTLSQLAVAVGQQGRFAEAEALHREALAVGRRVLGEEHPRIAFGLARYARTQMEHEQYENAESIYREALSLLDRQFGTGHPTVMTVEARLGTVLWKQGRFAEAERLLLASYQPCTSSSPPDDACGQATRAALISLYEAWGKPTLADRYRSM